MGSRKVVEKGSRKVAESESHKMAVSECRKVAESECRKVTESESHKLAESESHKMAESESRKMAESERRKVAGVGSRKVVKSKSRKLLQTVECMIRLKPYLTSTYSRCTHSFVTFPSKKSPVITVFTNNILEAFINKPADCLVAVRRGCGNRRGWLGAKAPEPRTWCRGETKVQSARLVGVNEAGPA